VRLSEDLGVLSANIGSFIAGDPLVDESATNFTLHKGLASALATDQPVAISDCGTTKIFAMDSAAVGDTNLGLSAVPGTNYCAHVRFRAGASLRKLKTVYYFVATSASGNTTSLYRQEEGAAAEELLEGVANLQLQFGVDDTGDYQVDLWDTADGITEAMWNGWDWTDGADGIAGTVDDTKDIELVRAVRYSLLFVTEDPVLGEAQAVVYNGATIAPADGRLRQVFTSSIGIRSRIK